MIPLILCDQLTRKQSFESVCFVKGRHLLGGPLVLQAKESSATPFFSAKMLFRVLNRVGSKAARLCTLQAAATTFVSSTFNSVSCQSNFGAQTRPQAWETNLHCLRLRMLPLLSGKSWGPEAAAKNISISQIHSSMCIKNRKPSHTEDGLATDAAKSRPASEPAPTKACTTCEREKLCLDFETTKTSIDGRTDTCRACLAAFYAKRAGKALYHLAWSSEVAWERGKVCPLCGVFKEARDFARNGSRKDKLFNHCRSCHSEKWGRLLQERAKRNTNDLPLGTSRQCCDCGKVKLARDFYRNKAYPYRRCKACHNKHVAQWSTQINTSMCLPRSDKKCVKCGEVKSADQIQQRQA